MTWLTRCSYLTTVMLVVVSSGCGSNRAAPTRSPTATEAPSPTNDPAAEALGAYRGMWDSFVEAAITSDPDAPALRQYTTDQALRMIVNSLAANRAQGKVVKGRLTTNPSVTSLQPAGQPTQAAITDCVDATDWLEYRKSGGLWDNEPGGKHHTTATVKATAGTWKVTSFTLEKAGSC